MLNTDPQLAETVITDSNSKEHTQNNVNQKEFPQLKQYFSFFIKIEKKKKKPEQKVPENQKTKHTKVARSHFPNFVCLYGA